MIEKTSRITTGLLPLLLLLSLSGCGALLEKWEHQNSFMASALPLCEYNTDRRPPCDHPPSEDALESAKIKEYLGMVINESVSKCSAFLTGLTLHSSGTATTLDGATTVFSALATAFTPLSVVHGLTAGAAVTSGWNSVIKADIYGRRTAENYAQAIQATYYQSLGDYMRGLGRARPDRLVRSLEIAKIRMIHKNCSLASAQSTISATLQVGASEASKEDEKTVTVQEPVKPGDTFTLTGPNGISVKVTASSSKASVVAQKLVAAVANPASNFTVAGVSASLNGAASASLTLRGPSGYKWTVSDNLKIDGPTATAEDEESGSGSAPEPPVAPGSAVKTTKR